MARSRADPPSIVQHCSSQHGTGLARTPWVARQYGPLYAVFRELGMFIGSGVVEAGCKTLVGQRLKLSGMRWNIPGATGILTLRCHRESNRWDQIWPQPNYQTSPSAGRRLKPIPATAAA